MFGVTMPVEIVLYTMSFLTARDLAAVAPVSSHCRALACEPELWHRLLYRDFYADPATMQVRGWHPWRITLAAACVVTMAS